VGWQSQRRRVEIPFRIQFSGSGNTLSLFLRDEKCIDQRNATATSIFARFDHTIPLEATVGDASDGQLHPHGKVRPVQAFRSDPAPRTSVRTLPGRGDRKATQRRRAWQMLIRNREPMFGRGSACRRRYGLLTPVRRRTLHASHFSGARPAFVLTAGDGSSTSFRTTPKAPALAGTAREKVCRHRRPMQLRRCAIRGAAEFPFSRSGGPHGVEHRSASKQGGDSVDRRELVPECHASALLEVCIEYKGQGLGSLSCHSRKRIS